MNATEMNLLFPFLSLNIFACPYIPLLFSGIANSYYKGSLPISLGARPYYLVDSMPKGDLKDELTHCAYTVKDFEKSDWSIGHRGACLQVRRCSLVNYYNTQVQTKQTLTQQISY